MRVAMSVVYENLRLEIPVDAPPFYAGLMTHCWYTEPTDRPDFKAIASSFLAHEKMESQGSITAIGVSTPSSAVPTQQDTTPTKVSDHGDDTDHFLVARI
jgi:hypothetical protein